MQTDNATQGSGLKTLGKVFWWVLGTAAAVPITKWVETQLSLSFFSPSIVELWNWILGIGAWLAQSVSVQLWLLLTIVVCTFFMATALGRMAMDADREQKAKDAILDATYAKLDDTISTLDSLDEELRATKTELGLINVKLNTAESELSAARAKIVDLETPKEQPLTEHQRIVLAAIEYYDNSKEQCYVENLSKRIKLTLVQTESSVDVLVKRKLVHEYYTGHGSRVVSLSPEGREHVLQPDFDMSHLPL